MSDDDIRGDQADLVTDSFPARVLRNEGRVVALEQLVRETRAADRQLIEQRADSLARELERRAEALMELVKARSDAVTEERQCDRREVGTLTSEIEKRADVSTRLINERYDSLISQNYEQSHIEIKNVREVHDLRIDKLTLRLDHEMVLAREKVTSDVAHIDERSRSALEQLAQQVLSWRTTDREARELFAAELNKHLDALNHNNERMAMFQTNSVTRELWQAEKDAAITREGLLRDQITALDRLMLTVQPIDRADKAHTDIVSRMEASIAATAQVLDNKIGVVSEKVAELKSYRDTTSGRSTGYAAFVGWGVAALGLITTVILLANFLIR